MFYTEAERGQTATSVPGNTPQRPTLATQLLELLLLLGTGDERAASRSGAAISQPRVALATKPRQPLVGRSDAHSGRFAGIADLSAQFQHPSAQKGSTFGRQSCMLMAVYPFSCSGLLRHGNHSFPNPGRMNNQLKHHTSRVYFG